MATLTIAVKANTALTLPLYLAGAYAAHGIGVDTVFKNTSNVDADNNVAELVAGNGQRTVDTAILRHLLHYLRSADALQKRNEIGEWIERLKSLTVLSFKALEVPVKELESHLALRSYMVGHSLTLANTVIWGALRGNRVIVGLRRNNQNINRWFNFIESAHPWLSDAVTKFYRQTQQNRAISNPTGANYNIGLKNTENGIVCRFPPEPSGYLHIGHAKPALLNDYFAHEYGDRRGTLICRFDDTNPSKESQEFHDSIMYDLSLLGVVPDRVTYSSDYFQQMYEACIRLINSGKAYADNTNKDLMRDQRMKGIASACRDMSVEETFAHFQEMKSGSQDGLQWCIRAKISVDNVNKALRDPVIYRCNHQPHHRTGSLWKIYPTYDFCAPYLDSAEGVTHALRTNEYRDRNPQYHWIQNALGVRPVEIWDFSRLSFVRTVLSKRKLVKFVDENIVWGWDDPRMPTVRGIRRMGCTIPALREFILKQGPSQNIVNMDWTQFWAVNKKYIDPVAGRYTAIPKLDVVTAYIDGFGETSSAQRPKHKNPDLGTKEVVFAKEILIAQDDARFFKDGEVITLMNWGNAIISSIGTDPKTGAVLTIQLKLDLKSDPKKTEKKITWLAKEPRNMVPVNIYFFDHLMIKDKIEKDDDDISLLLTKRSEFCIEVWADCNISRLRVDDVIQFDRTGYFRVDQAYGKGLPAVLFNIPTGRGA